MFTQRALQTSARRLVSQRPSSVVTKFASPTAVATNTHFIQRRQATSNASDQSILVEQRKHRPVAPHLSIYQPQITWYGSALNRITGVAVSGVFYVYGIGYLLAPALGIHMESAVLAASFAAWPIAAKVATKFIFALPFTYHSFNGLRHLTWDLGSMLTNKQVQQSGWLAVGAAVTSALYLAAFV